MNDETYEEVYQEESITVENLGGICMDKKWENGYTMDCMCAKEDGKVACKNESTQRYIDSLKREIEEKNDETMKLCREIDHINKVKDEEIERLKEENKKLEGLLSTAYSMFGELFELASTEK